mgnify:CR=1 FL=1
MPDWNDAGVVTQLYAVYASKCCEAHLVVTTYIPLTFANVLTIICIDRHCLPLLYSQRCGILLARGCEPLQGFYLGEPSRVV